MPYTFQRRHLLGCLSALALLGTTASHATTGLPNVANYRIVVGFAPGGVPDAAARLIANQLTQHVGAPVIVETRTGAGGTLAAQAVLNAPADGSTLLSVSPAHATAPAVFGQLRYDTLRDFAPVALIGEGPALIVVPTDLPAQSLAEFISLAQANPGKMNYSSAGVGSSSHFAAEMLRQEAGIDVVHIPYKGVAEALSEVVAGRTDFHIAPYTTAVQLLRDGRVRALAVTGPERLSDLPDVPTTAEAGLPSYTWTFWYGLLTSAQTPPATIERLHADITKILQQPDVQQQLTSMGVTVQPGPPEAFSALIATEIAKFKQLAITANIQPN